MIHPGSGLLQQTTRFCLAVLFVAVSLFDASYGQSSQETQKPGRPPTPTFYPPIPSSKQPAQADPQAPAPNKQAADEPKKNGGARVSVTVDEVVIEADSQSQNGDLVVFEGYVDATMNDMRLQADRVTLNTVTDDMIAEGNVIFDQGADQRVTARRAEINLSNRRGTFLDTTGFTNRTQTGEYLYFTAARVEKVGPESYVLYEATITACEDVIPKWSFNSKRAELRVDDRLKFRSAVFRVKSLPVFVLPYAWIPVTKSERKSGFLLPTTGSSNQKGRTLKLAYYQTLGQSADVTFRGDIYTQRGLGMGAEFRARTDEKSFLRLGIFSVKDRLFGASGEDQGGTAFFGEGVQYLPHGWLAVGNISVVTSLPFRQVFSDDISQVIDPRRESRFYANNNPGAFSLSFLAANETTTIFRPGQSPASGTDFDVKIRQAPEFNLVNYPNRIFESLPIYFSFDSSIGALKREELVDDVTVLVTPSAVQRFDFQPKLTIPLATVGGIAVTPSFSFRQTFYSNGLDTGVPIFDPDGFVLSPGDPRLDPARPEFQPDLRLFEPDRLDRVLPSGLWRRYSELAVEVRPPALEKLFLADDGSSRFKHLIEPYLTYRLISGVGDEFDSIIRFDDRDAVANTNEVEYAFVNRFFVTRSSSDVLPKRRKQRREENREGPTGAADAGITAGREETAAKPEEAADPQKSEPKKAPKRQRLETGKQEELVTKEQREEQEQRGVRDTVDTDRGDEEDLVPAQAYEFLTVKVAQKYFFDRTFGGALVEGRRNQFYPINTLSGFTFGGTARSFSPVNVSVRYRPLSSIYSDVRMDLEPEENPIRNVILSGGVSTDTVRVVTSWYFSRRIEIDKNSFEPGTFPGNQLSTILQFGDDVNGLYGGGRIAYDFTDRFINETDISTGRLLHTRSFIGYAWDCCGVQFNYNTFKAGLRSESSFSFTFTLAGLGSFGTDQFSQLGGGRGGRKRGRKLRAYDEGLR